MSKENGYRPRIEHRVSSAVWPASIRRVVATGRAAQRRRDWLMQRRWLVLLLDALSMRALFALTTLLVVASSLLVAIFGLCFWYLLLVPLLLFSLVLLLPLFLARKTPLPAPPPSLTNLAQELRSSTGISASAEPPRTRSPGHFQGVPASSPVLPADGETPATPVPDEPPLVRVLETYNLRETRIRRLFGEGLHTETDEQQVLQRHARIDFWDVACPTTFDSQPPFLENEHIPSSTPLTDLSQEHEQSE